LVGGEVVGRSGLAASDGGAEEEEVPMHLSICPVGHAIVANKGDALVDATLYHCVVEIPGSDFLRR
jgi:hypothetical protein